MTPILIAHNNALIRNGIRHTLDATEAFSIRFASSSEQAIALCRTGSIDVLIIDIHLPKMGTLELISRMRSYALPLKIVVIGADTSGTLAEKCIHAGARAYISSNISELELKKALETVIRGQVFVETSIGRKLAMTKLMGSQGVFHSLTSRELEIFLKLIEDKTTKDVADELYLAEKTVANYMSTLRKKLEVKTNIGLLRVALREGLTAVP